MIPAYDIDRNLDLHSPTTLAQNEALDDIREAAKRFARKVQENTPGCPEQTLAFRKIEEALFFAIASVVRP